MSQYLLSEGRLTPGDAAVALVVLEDGRYLLQLRDDIPGIFFPGHWGLFGGAMEPGEPPEAALRRELREELGVDLGPAEYLTEFSFDFPHHGRVLRHFYEVRVPAATVDKIVLGEGAGISAFAARTILTELQTVPYDAFAIWLHATRNEV